MNLPEENQSATGSAEQESAAPASPQGGSNGTPGTAGNHPVTQQELAAALASLPPLAEPTQAGTPAPDVEERPAPRESAGLKSLLATMIIVLFIITFVVQAFQIPSQSMERTLLVGDYLLVDKVHFGDTGPASWLVPYRDIHRGDIVVFHYPVDTTQHFVKRVIGVPGDKIRLRDKMVYVNEVPQRENYAIHTLMGYDGYRDNFPAQHDYTGQVDTRWRSDLQRYLKNGELVVPDGQYFVMGDNRDQSLDSRYWGFVPRENIVGRPLVIYLSLREAPETRAELAENRFFRSRNLFAHGWQFARWDRMFHLVR